jgi:hypothetical protein
MGSVPVRVVPARFVDQLFEITDRVLFRDYSAEKFAFGRVATELDSAACRAGLSSPDPGGPKPLEPAPVPERS